MNDANKSEPVQPSGTESLPKAQSSSETDARTVMEKTLSESGNEGSQTSPMKPGAVSVGSKLGPYLLVRKLGQGGMGAVYEARHTKLDKTFALKVLPPGFASNAASLSRFEREMKAVGKLNHPNIIKATNADEWNGTHYLVMEYIEGTDLSVLVKERGVLSVRDACKTIRQAALGLQHAHEHGLVHRDIKPSNLFLTKDGQVKLLDLGLARLGGDDKENAGLTSSGQMLGTPDYMAPEQWDDTRSADARADLYSLGCTLGYLLTGKAPFDTGKVRSFLHIMKAHSETSPPDLTILRRSVPAELNALYQRLLAKNPADRFQTAAEVATALEPFTRRADPPRPQHDAPASGSPRNDSPSAVGEQGGVSPHFVSGTALAAGNSPENADPESPMTSAIPLKASAIGLTPPRSPEAELKFENPTDSLSATSSFPRAAAAEEDSPLANTTSLSPASGAASVPQSVTEPMPRGANPPQRRWLIAAGLLACLVLAVLLSRVGRGTRPTDSEISNSSSSPNPQPPTPSPSAAGWHGWPADAPPPAIAPFDAEQAQQHQEAWAKYLGVPVEYTNSLGMKFRLIPPGEFLMGSTKEEIEEAFKDANPNDKHWQECIKSEAPQHKVIVTQPSYLGAHEVTQGQYQKLIGKNPSHFTSTGTGKDAVSGIETSNHPVEMVSWNDAAEFCARLSQQEKLKPLYFRAGETVTPLDGTGYRLATEAEWEFGCRAGTTGRYWSGDKEEDLVRVAWFKSNSGDRTHAVGELKSNPFGLYDIHGNAWEWVQDWWGPNDYVQFAEKAGIDPEGPSSAVSERVLRGGRWEHAASSCRASNRHAARPTYHNDPAGGVGFRVALPVDAVRLALKVTVPAMSNRPKVSVTDGSTSSTAKPLTPLPPLDLDETDPLPGWELPAGAPPPVVAPCEPTLATERQQLWAEFLKRPVIEENAATLKFALIPPGEFRKIFTRPRDPAIEPDMPVRRFRITKPYAISTTEVTWDQFRQFVEATGYQTEAETNGLGGRDREFKPDPNGKINWRTSGWKPAPNEPVTQVTPKDAEAGSGASSA